VEEILSDCHKVLVVLYGGKKGPVRKVDAECVVRFGAQLEVVEDGGQLSFAGERAEGYEKGAYDRVVRRYDIHEQEGSLEFGLFYV
jgi:hypothetical protein